MSHAYAAWRSYPAWTLGRPLMVITHLLDKLLRQVARRTGRGNTYRVLARKDS
jgi:hypothetical protein